MRSPRRSCVSLSEFGANSGTPYQFIFDALAVLLYRGSMARLSRIVVPGYPHHVTRRGVRSMGVFHSEENRREYIGMLGEETARHGVSILVWCLIPICGPRRKIPTMGAGIVPGAKFSLDCRSGRDLPGPITVNFTRLKAHRYYDQACPSCCRPPPGDLACQGVRFGSPALHTHEELRR